MTFALVLQMLATYGPSVIPLIDKFRQAFKAGRENEIVSDEEWAELKRLADQSAEDIYKRLGVTPPPPDAK